MPVVTIKDWAKSELKVVHQGEGAKDKQVAVRLTADEYSALEAVAKQLGRTITSCAREILARGVREAEEVILAERNGQV